IDHEQCLGSWSFCISSAIFVSVDFYREIYTWLIHEETVAIATVVQVNGSVPREASAKMLIRRGGYTSGTIGGGAGEAKVIQYAQHLLEGESGAESRTTEDADIAPYLDRSLGKGSLENGDRPEFTLHDSNQVGKGWVTIDLTGASHRDTQGVCGGIMKVWVELWRADWGIELVEKVIQALENKRAIALVTPLLPGSHPHLTPTDQAAAPIQSSEEQFIESLQPYPTLLVIGAGHVGVALAQVAAIAGFSVCVYDDRTEMLDPNRFPSKVTLMSGAIAHVLQQICITQECYIALVTRGVTYDVEALNALDKILTQLTPRYVGMMGSQKRINYVFNRLKETKANDQRLHQYLSQIHAPIGLAIGALTPAEIAVSICAEMIQIRRQRNIL
ncbi:MAG: XdhC family protein, partial [Leptolyngbyaceae bacterium]|nr:XdhC family protein [Leptolyngbyaceae bacterium]